MRLQNIILITALLFYSSNSLASPQRVVSLKPNITDIVYALGLGDRLVGVTRYCDIPADAKKPQVVADYTRPLIERIIALSPDLVLASKENSSRKSIGSLERLGLSVELFSFTTLEETMSSIRRVAASLGVAETGEKLAQQMEGQLNALKKRFAVGQAPRVVIVWGLKPLIVAGRGTYMDEVLGFIGVENAVPKGKVKYPHIGIEELIAMDPDVIIDLAMGSESGTNPADSRPWDKVYTIGAVRNNRVYRLDAGKFRAGPTLPDALANLAEMIHK